MADTALILGLAGVAGTIGGTVAGSLLTARSSAQLEERRLEREEARKRAGARTAARLVWADLAMAQASLNWAITSRTWSPQKVRIPLDAWADHRGQLAEALDLTDWEYLVVYHAGVAHLLAVVSALMDPGPLSDGQVESFEELNKHALTAHRVLYPLAGGDLDRLAANRD